MAVSHFDFCQNQMEMWKFPRSFQLSEINVSWLFTLSIYMHIYNFGLRDGNLLMLFATRISILAPFKWSPRLTCIYK